jgi:hypothetical protein
MLRIVAFILLAAMAWGCSHTIGLTPTARDKHFDRVNRLAAQTTGVVRWRDGRALEACALRVGRDSTLGEDAVTRQPLSSSTWDIASITFEEQKDSRLSGVLTGMAAGAGTGATAALIFLWDDSTRSSGDRIIFATLWVGGGTVVGGLTGAVIGMIGGGERTIFTVVTFDSTARR